MQKAYRIKVYGKVQGVFFRQKAKEMAQQLGLAGSAENLSDGTVEILIEGPQLPLTNFLNYLKQGNLAQIDSVEIEPCPPAGLNNFQIK